MYDYLNSIPSYINIVGIYYLLLRNQTWLITVPIGEEHAIHSQDIM